MQGHERGRTRVLVTADPREGMILRLRPAATPRPSDRVRPHLDAGDEVDVVEALAVFVVEAPVVVPFLAAAFFLSGESGAPAEADADSKGAAAKAEAAGAATARDVDAAAGGGAVSTILSITLFLSVSFMRFSDTTSSLPGPLMLTTVSIASSRHSCALTGSPA